MTTRPLWTCLALAAAAALGGCGSTTRIDEPIWLDVRGDVGIKVDSFNGDVRIETNPQYEYAMVQVKRRAAFGSGRGKEARSAVDQIRYRAEMVAGDAGPVLTVTTWTGATEPWNLAADIRIFLPSADGVTIRTDRGKVEAFNVMGNVDIEVRNGDVWVLTRRPMVRPVSITTQHGAIAYRVPPGSTGLFNCSSTGGRVRQKLDFGRVDILEGTTNDRLVATVAGEGEPTNPILLRATGGDVNISIVKNPTDVGAVIKTP